MSWHGWRESNPRCKVLETRRLPVIIHPYDLVGRYGVEPFPEGAVLQTACWNRQLYRPLILEHPGGFDPLTSGLKGRRRTIRLSVQGANSYSSNLFRIQKRDLPTFHSLNPSGIGLSQPFFLACVTLGNFPHLTSKCAIGFEPTTFGS